MWQNGRFALISSLLALILLVLRPTAVAQEDELATPTPASWLRLPDMPETATQADYGAEIYRLVCRDCHGDVGQGLTDEWRAKGFSPEDQNCWQSKCHTGSHPVDGFVLPKYVPPLAGEASLSRFNTSLDLFHFIRAAMPYHDPGNLLDREYWQLTAFILELRQSESLTLILDETTATQLRLHPNKPTLEPTAVSTLISLHPQPAPTATETWLWGFLGLLLLIGLGTAVLLWRRP